MIGWARRGARLAVFAAAAAAAVAPGVVHAEHGGPSLWLFPPEGSTLPANGPAVFLSVNGQSPALPAKGAEGLALVVGGERVPLRVVETHRDHDGYGEAAAVLRPKRRLAPGRTADLAVPDLYWDPDPWTVGPADETAPRWTAPPRVAIARDDDPGYPGYPLVRLHVDESGPLLLRAVVRDAAGEERSALWGLTLFDGCAFTGYLTAGMKGPFAVRLTVVDAGGNETSAPGDALTIDGHAYLCLERPNRRSNVGR